MRVSLVVGWLAAGAVLLSVVPAMAQETEQRWTLRLEGIFQGGTKPLYLYARERGGEWIGVIGSSRDPDRMGGKTYNRSWYYGDLSGVPIRSGRVKGRFTLHVTPDLWVPLDHKGYTIDFEVDAKVTGGDKLDGTFRIVEIHSKDWTVRDLGRSGRFHGTAEPKGHSPPPQDFTLVCNMQGALVGGKPQYGNRCMVLWLGVEDGKLTSTSYGLMSKKLTTYGRTGFESEGNTVTATGDRFRAHVTVPTTTLDMEPCRYVFDIDGRLLDGLLVGAYELTVEIEGQPGVRIDGSFDGNWHEGVQHVAKEDDRPWFTEVEGFKPVAAGEHPRLLFRQSDLPALRRKAETPEGRAILKRLGYLLDGDRGETMTTVFSKATHAYMGGGFDNEEVNKPGVYTIGHVAGYGLLYQLTGDQKYAEFAKRCFEKALAGVRDRDDRYSFRRPGGALRAGTSVGWYAVGYDLCYDGWDPATREKFGRAIAEYSVEAGKVEGEDPYVTKYKSKTLDLESLARGTMPPASNHFGLEVGGASLALLAVTGEEFVNQDKIDTLLAVARQSMIRNMSQGFGDGGFFAEGDGTGSMSSQITFLAALQAWGNARGKDFINVQRPNARMMTLKWPYLTVVRDGKPHFWPIRGSYGHNVWSRGGLSGAGYFAYGFAGVTDEQKAAMKWYYNRFFLEADRERGAPYDTASRYPQVAVCALVNWPVKQEPKDPDEALPHCYRDSTYGFYAWRNRWQDGDDTVISLLTTRTEGYMSSRPDRALRILSKGRRISWGTVEPGPTKYWWRSPQGETSVLTLSDGTSFAVDFTGASGADVMLVTTGQAEGRTVEVAGKKLTFYFPTAETAPEVTVEGNAAVAGAQRVTVEGGNLVLAVKGK